MAAKGTIIKKAFNNITKAGGVAVPAYMAARQYNDSRESGKGVVSSIASAGMDFAVGEALGFWKSFGVAAVQAAPGLISNAYQAADRMSRQVDTQNANTPFMNSRFGDTQPAYTMRQYGMQLAKNSKYSLEQSLMGNEAQHFKY